MGNAAGLIRVGNAGAKVILSTSAVTALVGGLPPLQAGQMQEAKGLKSWTFQLDLSTGAPAATFTATIWGTTDPATAAGTASNWFQLPAGASNQNGFNPMTAGPGTAVLIYNGPLVAVCATAGGTAGGTLNVLAFAVGS